MPHKVLFLFDFKIIESTCMHKLLMKVTGMRLKRFLAEVFVLLSMGNELGRQSMIRYGS